QMSCLFSNQVSVNGFWCCRRNKEIAQYKVAAIHLCMNNTIGWELYHTILAVLTEGSLSGAARTQTTCSSTARHDPRRLRHRCLPVNPGEAGRQARARAASYPPNQVTCRADCLLLPWPNRGFGSKAIGHSLTSRLGIRWQNGWTAINQVGSIESPNAPYFIALSLLDSAFPL